MQHSLEYSWEEAESVDEMMKGHSNYSAVLWWLWDKDYTPIIMERVAAEYGFFRQAGKDQLKVFNAFCNKLIAANAETPERYPKVYDEAEKIAINVLQNANCLPYKPSVARMLTSELGETGGDRGRGSRGDRGDRPTQPPPDRSTGSGLAVGKVPTRFADMTMGKEILCGMFQKVNYTIQHDWN